jgi:hypothetical protein
MGLFRIRRNPAIGRGREMFNAQPRRDRIVYTCATAIAIAAWLAINSHRYAGFLPDLVADYADDAGATLWALAVFAAIGLVFRSSATWQAAAGAFVISALVEFSQLYHAPWIDSIRDTAPAALALSPEFVATDLGCYAGGVFLGMLIEFWTLD